MTMSPTGFLSSVHPSGESLNLRAVLGTPSAVSESRG